MQEAVQLERLGRVPEAIAAYERALARTPQLPDCWYNLARLQRRSALYPRHSAVTPGPRAPHQGRRRGPPQPRRDLLRLPARRRRGTSGAGGGARPQSALPAGAAEPRQTARGPRRAGHGPRGVRAHSQPRAALRPEPRPLRALDRDLRARRPAPGSPAQRHERRARRRSRQSRVRPRPCARCLRPVPGSLRRGPGGQRGQSAQRVADAPL